LAVDAQVIAAHLVGARAGIIDPETNPGVAAPVLEHHGGFQQVVAPPGFAGDHLGMT